MKKYTTLFALLLFSMLSYAQVDTEKEALEQEIQDILVNHNFESF